MKVTVIELIREKEGVTVEQALAAINKKIEEREV